MNTALRALVLDFGGVISRTVFETHAENEKVLGLPAGTLTWRGPFDPTGDDLWRRMQAGEITERDYWYSRAAETGKLIGENWTALPQFLQRIRGDDPTTMIRPEFLDALRIAKAGHCKLAILSNELDLFYGEGFRVKLPFLAQFDLIIDATYTKILKPDPRAYRLCLDGLSLPADACVFVDDQKRNVDGAIAVGIPAVHFDVTNPARSYAEALALLGLKTKEPLHA